MYSDFWAFDIPIYKEWLSDDDVRHSLEEASSKHGGLDEEHRNILLEHVQSNASTLQMICSASIILQG